MAGTSRWGWTLAAVIAVAGAAGAYVWSGGSVPPQVAGWLNAAGIGPKAPPKAEGATAPGPGSGMRAGGTPGGGPGGGRPPVSVAVGKAARAEMPVRIDGIGTVQPVASVTLRSRVDSQITHVGFEDGARVKKGDVLYQLDSRQIEAQIAQAEANVARDRASLQAAEADLRRTEALARRDFATEKLLDTARANVGQLVASIRSGQAQVDNLKVQRSYFTISAPISGRLGVAGLKLGNIAKAGDASVTLGTINQMAPIYVSFALPQRHLPDIRASMAAGATKVIVTPQGFAKGVEGTLAVVDNSVDAQTGTITLRAQFENADEMLWPGALCQIRMILRMEPNALVVPRVAVMSGQSGNFVFVVDGGVVRVKPVKIDRIVDDQIVLAQGLSGGEAIVVDGQQLLTDGARVIVRTPGSGASAPAAGSPAPAQTTRNGVRG